MSARSRRGGDQIPERTEAEGRAAGGVVAGTAATRAAEGTAPVTAAEAAVDGAVTGTAAATTAENTAVGSGAGATRAAAAGRAAERTVTTSAAGSGGAAVTGTAAAATAEGVAGADAVASASSSASPGHRADVDAGAAASDATGASRGARGMASGAVAAPGASPGRAATAMPARDGATVVGTGPRVAGAAPLAALSRPGTVLGAVGRWAGAIAGALVIFSALVLVKGADPVAALADMVVSLLTPVSAEQIAIKAAPLILAAMAVVVPARAGLANVGGEGQIIIGAVCAAGVGLAIDSAGPVALVAMLVAGALGGALWAGIAAAMRLTVGVNEAITTLLLNYVALDLMLYLIYEPWKDPDGSGQPATRPLEVAARLPLLGTTGVHAGIVIALVAAVAVWLVLRGTAFGFRLGVTGGNPEAARRARLPVGRLLLAAMLLGGALAGLAGVVHFAGVEFKLRPGLTANFGYIAFLAAWLARHRPLPAVGGAFLLAAIVVGGDSLQLDGGLPAATVNVLMGLVLLAVLGWTARRPRNAAG